MEYLNNNDQANSREEQRRREEQLISGLEYYGKEVFKKQLQVLHAELIPAQRRRSRLRRMRLLVLSAAALLLLLLSFWFLPPTAPSDPFGAYYHPYALQLDSRDTVDSTLAQATQLYQNRNCQQALPLLETLLAAQPQQLPLQLACGNCYLQQQQPEAALRWFRQTLRADDLLYRDPARWYAALAELQRGQLAAAKALLRPLADNSAADYHKEAQALYTLLD